MTLVGVAPRKFPIGVDAPSDDGNTFDWRITPGDDGNRARVEPEYVVTDLGNMLRETYRTDAHFVAYTVRRGGASMLAQPRVNKGGLGWLREQGYELAVEALFVDVDNPGHVAWTPALRAEFEALRFRAASLRHAGIYTTSHGYRVVQPLTHGVSVERAEACTRTWLTELEREGVRVDWSCVDWTRHYRAPHVRRAGQQIRGELFLERMQPIAPPAGEVVQRRGKAAAAARRPDGVELTRELPPTWTDHVSRIAAPIRAQGFVGQRHKLFLALAGALLGRRVPPENVPIIVASVASVAGTEVESAWKRGASTVRKWARGDAVAGAKALGELAPHVLAAVDEVTRPAAARAVAHAADEAEPTESLDEVSERLVETIRGAGDGVTLIRAQCGLGKTRAASIVAIERASKTHARKGEHKRAPRGAKTAISVPTTALARELAERFRDAGVEVQRRFGPLSVLRGNEHECRLHAQASLVAAGGQSVPYEFCQGRGTSPCEHKETCDAWKGVEGPDEALICVGPHAMIGELAEFAGSTGLLVIDEPPPMLTTQTLRKEELRGALAGMKSFEWRFAAALAPCIKAAEDWLENVDAVGYVGRTNAAADPPTNALDGAVAYGVDADLLADAFVATGVDNALGAARAAFDEGHEGATTPPTKRADMYAARKSASMAKAIGETSRVLRAIWTATNVEGTTVRVEERGAEQVLVCACVDERYRNALAREGVTIALDANAELHAPVIASVLGYEPPRFDFAAPDGAPIERTFYQVGDANRKAWQHDGRLHATPALLRNIAALAEWVAERHDVGGIGVITTKPLRLVLEAAVDDRDVKREWTDAGQLAAHLQPIVDKVRPQVGGLVGRVVRWGHYGAMRGIDAWKHLGALATIGDPWQNVGDLQHEADFLRLDAWEARAEAVCRAELEQAHGRLRTVHRTTPARMLHVGAVLPGGWRDFVARRPAAHRPHREETMPVEQLRAAVIAVGGISAACRRWRCGRSSLNNYIAGERGVPPPLVAIILSDAAVLRDAAAE